MTTAAMDQTTTDTIKQYEAGNAVLKRSVCLTLNCRFMGNNRRVDLDDLVKSAGGEEKPAGEGSEVTLDESVFHATKRLLDPAVLRPPMRVISLAKHELKAMSIPSHKVFGEGTVLLPLVSVKEAIEKLKARAAELAEAVEVLVENYDTAKEEQRTKLGPHFKEDDYVSKEQVRASFGLHWRFISFQSPDALETVDAALAMESNAQHEAALADMFTETVTAVRQAALTVMQDLVDNLGENKNGKPKGLRGTALDELTGFCDRLPALNSIAGDDELAKIVEKVRRGTAGLNVKDLRESKELRAGLTQLAKEASEALKGLVVETRGRSISFGSL